MQKIKKMFIDHPDKRKILSFCFILFFTELLSPKITSSSNNNSAIRAFVFLSSNLEGVNTWLGWPAVRLCAWRLATLVISQHISGPWNFMSNIICLLLRHVQDFTAFEPAIYPSPVLARLVSIFTYGNRTLICHYSNKLSAANQVLCME